MNKSVLDEGYFLKLLYPNSLFISKEEYKENMEGEQITFKLLGKNVQISVNLLQKLLSDDRYYKCVEELFFGNMQAFYNGYLSFGKLIDSIELSRIEIVKGIQAAMSIGKIRLGDQEAEKMGKMMEEVSFKKFLDKYKDEVHKTDIDGKEISIRVSDITNFLQFPNEYYDIIMEELNQVFGIPKEEFIYSVVNFFNSNEIFDKYDIPKYISDRVQELIRNKKVDIEAFNKFSVPKSSSVSTAIVNDDLKRKILIDMPDSLSLLEKAIYIYIKMCKILTYDEEFYAVNQKGEVAKKHEQIENISNITPQNNKVVCYEFNAIYAKLLEELGINFEVKSATGKDDFGGGHAYLEFRDGKFLLMADSVISILNSDLFNAKMNLCLNGLSCINTNSDTRKEFQEIAAKVYGLIVLQEKESKEDFDEILEDYIKSNEDIPAVLFDEKISILLNKINSSSLVGADVLSYITYIRKIIFTKQECQDNVKINIVRNNNPIDRDKVATATAIFTINNESVENNTNENVYLLYNPGYPLTGIAKSDLELLFYSRSLEYIDKKSNRVPGIRAGDDNYVRAVER